MADCLVAYLDVLGFRSLVEDPKRALDLQDCLATIERELTKQLADKKEIYKIVFSDTVVVATQVVAGSDGRPVVDQFSTFLVRIRNLQFECAKRGHFLRGGVTIGPLHFNHEKPQVVGIAMNRAYDLEKLAIYPRVIIDPQIICKFAEKRSEFIDKINNRSVADEADKRLIFDSDCHKGLSQFPNDAIFIDYLAPLRCTGQDAEQIVGAIAKSCNGGQDFYLKYRWLIDYAARVALDGPVPGLTSALQAL